MKLNVAYRDEGLIKGVLLQNNEGLWSTGAVGEPRGATLDARPICFVIIFASAIEPLYSKPVEDDRLLCYTLFFLVWVH